MSQCNSTLRQCRNDAIQYVVVAIIERALIVRLSEITDYAFTPNKLQ
jgi:hypothetical protein